MPRNVLDHILEATDARPCGRDRWMGHGLCHGSKKHRDLSIRRTGDRILLHDFTGCELSVICRALGVRVPELFDDAPTPRGSRGIPKAVRPDRPISKDFQFELAAFDLRQRADKIIGASKQLNVALLNDSEFDRALGFVAQAHHDVQRAELFEGVADELRERDYHARENRVRQERIA